MRSVRILPIVAALAALVACDEEPFTSKGPEAPPPPVEGVQAFLQVDNDRAQPGERVHVYVKVQFGTETSEKLGSYTGRITFDPEALNWLSNIDIDDGMRVVNPNHAAEGVVRFAGAAARGFEELTLYHGVFEVVDAGYMDKLALQMEELSASRTLTNLEPQLHVTPQVFLRETAAK